MIDSIVKLFYVKNVICDFIPNKMVSVLLPVTLDRFDPPEDFTSVRSNLNQSLLHTSGITIKRFVTRVSAVLQSYLMFIVTAIYLFAKVFLLHREKHITLLLF